MIELVYSFINIEKAKSNFIKFIKVMKMIHSDIKFNKIDIELGPQGP